MQLKYSVIRTIMDEDAMFTANHVTTTRDIIHAIQILVQKYVNQVMETVKKTFVFLLSFFLIYFFFYFFFAKGYSTNCSLFDIENR